jgi:hypothetical protein
MANATIGRMEEWSLVHSIIYFAIAMLFGGLANACSFFVLGRMRSLGRNVGAWRWPHKDIALYRDYWNLAPERNWSRAPLIIGLVSFILAAYFLLSLVPK